MARRISDSGLQLIKRFEGLRLEAYPDACGIWTIGYGHTRGVCAGMCVTEAEADAALRDDLSYAERAVQAAISTAPTSDDAFAAMTSLCFNVGPVNFRASSVLRHHKAAEHAQAADSFLLWNKARISGVLKELPGLTARRSAERALYLGGG